MTTLSLRYLVLTRDLGLPLTVDCRLILAASCTVLSLTTDKHIRIALSSFFLSSIQRLTCNRMRSIYHKIKYTNTEKSKQIYEVVAHSAKKYS